MIINDDQRRTLQFIAVVNRGGWRPTGREINEWRRNPEPKPPRKGKLLEPEVPATPDRRVRVGGALGNWMLSDAVRKNLQGLAWQPPSLTRFGVDTSSVLKFLESYERQIAPIVGELKTIPGKPGRPAVYAPDRPEEGFLAHLRRLGWIERDERRRYAVTQLGHALLRGDAVDAETEESPVIVLEADDELAYGQVLGVIADCGDALVVDPYLGTEQLGHILRHTSASRFLIGSKLGKSRIAELALLVEVTPADEGVRRELRKADFHDRWLIGEHFVYGLGSSLNGVGKNTTTLVHMPEPASGIIRSWAEDLWASAQSIAQTSDADTDDGDEVQQAS